MAETIKHRASLLTAMVDFMPSCAFFQTDSGGLITVWNQKAEQIFGYPDKEILGKSVAVLYSVDTPRKNQLAKHLNEATAKGLVKDEGLSLHKDGHSFPARCLIVAQHNAHQSLTGFLFFIIDLNQQMLSEKQRLSTAAIELSPDAMITTDRDAIIQSWNFGAQKTYGYAADEIIGKSMQVLFAEGESCPRLEELTQTVEVEFAHITKSRASIFTSTRLSPLTDASGRNEEFLWICRDITTNKKILDELARSNKDLQQFAYVASHDLQEPVRAVIGCLQLLEESLQSPLSERSRMFMDEASKGATRMQSLINDLLSYAQIQTKAAEMTATDLSTTFKQALENLQGPIAEAQAQIQCEQLPVLEVDRSQIRQVFQNFIANAIKYRRGNPTIHVTAKEAKGEWIFCINDNGIGFDMQFAERIFDIFQRLQPRSKYPGTGIGLAICRRVIHRHGGRIWAESEPLQGAKFYFTLPIKQPGADQ